MGRARAPKFVYRAAVLLAAGPCAGCLVEGSGSKAFDAVASAAAAGAVTVANEVESRQAARQSRSEPYDGCSAWECYGATDITLEEARAYALAYINHARKGAGLEALALDYTLDEFAQVGSKDLSRDHQPHQHLEAERRACPICAETQGDPGGLDPAPTHVQLDAALAFMLSEGPGGPSHDVLLGAAWHRLGVGVVNPGGRMYFTVDFAP